MSSLCSSLDTTEDRMCWQSIPPLFGCEDDRFFVRQFHEMLEYLRYTLCYELLSLHHAYGLLQTFVDQDRLFPELLHTSKLSDQR